MTALPQAGPPHGQVWRIAEEEVVDRHEWSGAECVRALRRRKTTLAWITGAAVFVAALLSAVQPRYYQSEALLEVQNVNENYLSLRDVNPTATPSADSSGAYVQTQVELLQQDELLERVARKLGLSEREEFQHVPGFWHKFRRAAGSKPTAADALETAVEALKQNVRIVPSRSSRVIRVVCDARDPRLAADIANTLAVTFIEEGIAARQQSARQTLASLSLQLQNLGERLHRSAIELGHAPRAAYGALKDEMDADRRFYEAMSQRANEAAVASVVRQSDIRLASPARPSPHPYTPNLPLNLAIGILGGLVMATGYILLREQTSSALHVPGDAHSCLKLPELGAIPKTAHGILQGPPAVGRSRPLTKLAIPERRFSGPSESFRATLASILSSSRNGDSSHILAVTSSRPMEGKTTVVSNLGIALAEISGKVLLIDGDMRRPTLHKVFDQSNSWGLSDILREKNAIEELPLHDLVKKTPVPHLYLLPSGASTDNVFRLLHSGRMASLLPRFRQEFDYVLVDTPPCLEFADARIMARHAGKLLLVVRADYTERKMAQAAVQQLLLDEISVMGVILNRWDPAGSGLYWYGGDEILKRRGLA